MTKNGKTVSAFATCQINLVSSLSLIPYIVVFKPPFCNPATSHSPFPRAAPVCWSVCIMCMLASLVWPGQAWSSP